MNPLHGTQAPILLRHAKWICRVDRLLGLKVVEAVGHTVVLHPDRFSYHGVKCLENALARLLLKNHHRRIEIPVVLPPVAARLVAAASGSVVRHSVRFGSGLVIHSRPRAD